MAGRAARPASCLRCHHHGILRQPPAPALARRRIAYTWLRRPYTAVRLGTPSAFCSPPLPRAHAPVVAGLESLGELEAEVLCLACGLVLHLRPPEAKVTRRGRRVRARGGGGVQTRR